MQCVNAYQLRRAHEKIASCLGRNMKNTIPDEISRKILAILREHLRFVSEDPEFPMDTNLEKLGLDSMSAIDLLLNLEQTFEILFPDSMLTVETFRTATTLEEAVRSLVSG